MNDFLKQNDGQNADGCGLFLIVRFYTLYNKLFWNQDTLSELKELFLSLKIIHVYEKQSVSDKWTAFK